jgi:hypothetical protein
VKRNFTPRQSRHGTAGRCAREGARREIRSLPWMSEETKKSAEGKLARSATESDILKMARLLGSESGPA